MPSWYNLVLAQLFQFTVYCAHTVWKAIGTYWKWKKIMSTSIYNCKSTIEFSSYESVEIKILNEDPPWRDEQFSNFNQLLNIFHCTDRSDVQNEIATALPISFDYGHRTPILVVYVLKDNVNGIITLSFSFYFDNTYLHCMKMWNAIVELHPTLDIYLKVWCKCQRFRNVTLHVSSFNICCQWTKSILPLYFF